MSNTKKKKSATLAANSLIVIVPYRCHGTWVFDDSRVGLVREPFVSGIPEMIDKMVTGIDDASEGFQLTFSADPFPDAQIELDWDRPDGGGNYYRWNRESMEGWLCPALFCYFDKAPAKLYAAAKSLKPEDRPAKQADKPYNGMFVTSSGVSFFGYH